MKMRTEPFPKVYNIALLPDYELVLPEAVDQFMVQAKFIILQEQEFYYQQEFIKQVFYSSVHTRFLLKRRELRRYVIVKHGAINAG